MSTDKELLKIVIQAAEGMGNKRVVGLLKRKLKYGDAVVSMGTILIPVELDVLIKEYQKTNEISSYPKAVVSILEEQFIE